MDTEISRESGSVLADGSPIFPVASERIPGTATEAVDEALRDLQANKDAWTKLEIDNRIDILDHIKKDLSEVKEPWIARTLDEKGIPTESFAELEEWVLIGALFRMLRVLRRSLVEIKRYGRPRTAGPVKLRPDGQVVVPVFPQTFFDRIVYQGVRGEVWMEPNAAPEQIERDQARSYRETSSGGAVVAVLGAGNLGMLPIADFMHKLFVESKVAVLKLNPVNDYIGPLIEAAFAELVSRGYLRVVYGGSKVGSYLCNHRLIDEIHMTGSDKTFEAIVFGTGSDAASRKANRQPILDKSITSELGNVSPVIVVPGEWNDDDIRVQSVRLASWLGYNAGCNCITPRVIIQHENWHNRDRFVSAIGEALSELPTRKAYYPGAFARQEKVLKVHPEAQLHGEVGPDHLPWTFVADVDSTNAGDICFRREPFYGQFSETALEASTIPEFIDRAVEFANGTLWGNLAVTLLIHPKSFQDSRIASAIEQAIAGLRYGWVCLNFYPGIAYALWVSPHGAFPGNDIANVQSGVGLVNNFLMLEGTQKSVFRAPFRSPREPALFTTKSMDFGKKLAQFEESPSIWNLSSLGLALMRS